MMFLNFDIFFIDKIIVLYVNIDLIWSCICKLIYLINLVCIDFWIGVVVIMDVVEVCKDVNIVVMVGGFFCKEGMECKDVMFKNVFIYKV